ncbi:MAG: Holliday junction branch migration protein RuvA [Verrucomicrobiota bacterium]|nr:Holliday junction branch migration protein RuvA [Verrucomicrobiota bacterium]
MYEAIQGILKEKEMLKAIVETGGLFYRLTIPANTLARLPSLETPIFFFLSHVVREDAETLFAFLSKEERNLFEKLLTLSGIGPKAALSIVGHMEIDTFYSAVLSCNTSLLSKIPGIGKKSAERLVLELKDGLKGTVPKGSSSLISDATSALLNLGYSISHVQKAIESVVKEKKEIDLTTLITSALQKISR